MRDPFCWGWQSCQKQYKWRVVFTTHCWEDNHYSPLSLSLIFSFAFVIYCNSDFSLFFFPCFSSYLSTESPTLESKKAQKTHKQVWHVCVPTSQKTFFKSKNILQNFFYVPPKREKKIWNESVNKWWQNDHLWWTIPLQLCTAKLNLSNPVTGSSSISQITIIAYHKIWAVKLKWSWSIWGMCLAQAPALGAHSGACAVD